ncbi:MAG: aminoglycoside nucleotidyltransferase [Chloroflexi bacterium]|nr:aminoglycoside nucleotidyltransferase [Chloroflexota bacterium]
MTAESTVRLLGALADHGVDICVGGGWAVDALLGRQTRLHADLDLWLEAADIEPLFVAVSQIGLDRILPCPGDRPWNFVLHDGARLRLDLHFYEPMADGRLHYGGCSRGDVFPAAALGGDGTIGGRRVRCEAPGWAVRWHTGFAPRIVDRHDVLLLCERFGLPLPDTYR